MHLRDFFAYISQKTVLGTVSFVLFLSRNERHHCRLLPGTFWYTSFVLHFKMQYAIGFLLKLYLDRIAIDFPIF